MNKLIALLLMILLMPSLCLAGAAIPASEQFILKEENAYVDKGSFWTPSKAETQKTLEAIESFLDEPDKHTDIIKRWHSDLGYAKGELEKIRKNFSKYGVQFVGVTLNGKKLIHCNFGPAGTMGQNYSVVKDGGFWHWQIDYDMETGKLMGLWINGYA